MSLYPRIERLGSSLNFLHHFIIGSPDTSLFLVVVRKLPLITSRVVFPGYCIDGRPKTWCILFCKKSFNNFLNLSSKSGFDSILYFLFFLS